jgi:DedD protein
MPATQDTEITLGTGKMLALFFGLVALCGVFFGMGYKLGKGSVAAPTAGGASAAPAASTSGARPSAVKTNSTANAPAADVAFYRSSGQNTASGTQATGGTQAPPAGTADNPPPEVAAAPSQNAYYVQVAAVSKQDDGEALVDALKKKQYPAFASAGPDKLFHVQVGPFSDVKSAEDMRAKLVSDGYNPILKK